jgi:hypothetical protein
VSEVANNAAEGQGGIKVVGSGSSDAGTVFWLGLPTSTSTIGSGGSTDGSVSDTELLNVYVRGVS